MDTQIEIGGIYRHYKGGTYKVLHIATHSETNEEMVVYQDLCDDNKIYTRPLKMFMEKVDININTPSGYTFTTSVNRFNKI